MSGIVPPGQLADPKPEVRLAAVYVLREVAKDFPDLANPVFELFQAYLRSRDIDYGDEEPPIERAGNHQGPAKQTGRVMMHDTQSSAAQRVLDIHVQFCQATSTAQSS